MKLFFHTTIIVVVFSVPGTRVVANPTELPINARTSRAVGNALQITQAPYTAQIRRVSDDRLACSGAILNFLYILTTASCVFDYAAKDLIVFVGTSNFIDGTSYSISEIIIHEEYEAEINEGGGRSNDIAMLRIDGFIRFSAAVRPVKVPEVWESETLDEESAASVTGWGDSSSLRKIDLTVKSSTECNESYDLVDKTINDDFICATNDITATSHEIDEIENGSPLVQNSVLIGLKSWRISGHPHVFTRIFAHKFWLDEKNVE